MSQDDLFDLKAEREDWETGNRSSRKKTVNQETSEMKSSGTNVSVLLFTLILAVLLAGMGYWGADQISQIYQQFDRSNKQLSLLSQRIEVLEGKLDISNDSMATSSEALKATLKEHDSEIRKLWGVSYDRNRKTIQEHKKSIANLNAAIKKIKTSNADFNKQIKTINKQLDEVMALKLTSAIPELESKVSKTDDRMAQISQSVDSVLPKVSGFDQRIGENKSEIKGLNDELLRSITDIQIQLNDDSIDKEINELNSLVSSIDKNRIRVNSELVKLSNKVNELQKLMSAKP